MPIFVIAKEINDMATIYQKMRVKACNLMIKNNTDMVSLPAKVGLALGIEYVTLKKKTNIQGINFDEEYVPIKDNDVKTVYDAIRKELNDIHLQELSKEDFKKLERQIVMGSLYVDDYENTFGVSPIEVASYAEGYLEAKDYPEECGEYDSFYDYVQSVEWID